MDFVLLYYVSGHFTECKTSIKKIVSYRPLVACETVCLKSPFIYFFVYFCFLARHCDIHNSSFPTVHRLPSHWSSVFKYNGEAWTLRRYWGEDGGGVVGWWGMEGGKDSLSGPVPALFLHDSLPGSSSAQPLSGCRSTLTFSPLLIIPMVGNKPPTGSLSSRRPTTFPFRVKNTCSTQQQR